MNILQILFLLILVIPFVEIYLLLQVGSVIGAAPTIFLVVLTAAVGSYQLKQQGWSTWLRFQQSMARGEVPAYEIIEGPIILLGGALLLTPGFITDAIGLICLIPSLRRRCAQYLIERHLVQAVVAGFRRRGASQDVLEGEFRKEDDRP